MPDKSENTESPAARQYWEQNPTAAALHQWTSNPIIAERVYRRMSAGATSKHWLSWLIEDYFAGRKFRSLLSPGCGTGDHELAIARTNIVDQIDAFDFSEASIAIARSNAEAAKARINYYTDNLNSFSIPKSKRYDLVLCSGSLHHVKDLEHFLGTVARALESDGYFIVNEYVGACYNIYPARQLQLINRLLEKLPASLRSDAGDKVRNATIQQAIETDASESVRSALITTFLPHYFDIELMHPFGGALLHPMYPFLNHQAFTSGDEKTDTVLRLLAEFEEILMELAGGLQSDFCLFVCRPKRS